MFSHRLCVLIVWMLPASILFCGCESGSTQYQSGEAAAVQEAVSEFPDSAADLGEKVGVFVEGAAPDAAGMKPFEAYSPSAKKVTITGNTAIAEVEFEVIATGEILPPKEWTLEKVGEEWKIKTYPGP